MKIEGAHVVITGASRGIGAALGREFHAAGAHVHLVARSDATRELAVALGSRATAWVADVADPDQVATMAAGVLAVTGSPDVVINNAGVGRYLYVEETTPEEARAQIETPYLGAFFVTRAFLPSMLAARNGRIANVTSPAARTPWPGATGYTAARWAMRGFDAALAADLHGTGVRPMLVMPGKVNSTYFEHNPGSEARVPRVTSLIPAMTPEQVAAAVVSGIRRDARSVVVPWQLRWLLRVHAVLPGPIDSLMIRTGAKREVAI